MKKSKKKYIKYFPILGCISTGLIYTAIGVIAMLSLLRLKEGGASKNSLLAYVQDLTGGKIIIWAILLGMLCYIVWRIYESFHDPYHYGKGWKGLARRTGIGLSSLADAFIAYSALIVLLGSANYSEHGTPEQKREMTANMLDYGWGKWLVVGLGVLLTITAAVQLFYGITRGYRERLDIVRFSRRKKATIFFLGFTGYVARGVILGIIGFFFIKSGILSDPGYVVNTDKAFNFIGDHIGKVPFAIVAFGIICYGLFMFALGITYDLDNDPSDPNFSPRKS
ncbi:DUF1206 domain-containing protein [Zunongwangia sp. F260]|uniref:DUF1206 domain-containing protein n=1 Tax=Autumnicola lenta TaxID=3075593 RepID=A0ABU3CPA3_9FLAO|nr:DUF1206 domain-containing protein [Zunongwangia sp. F260]MDT0647770.1 DUF1206 domain-containing protein [Zunongwangia sp. F260]